MPLTWVPPLEGEHNLAEWNICVIKRFADWDELDNLFRYPSSDAGMGTIMDFMEDFVMPVIHILDGWLQVDKYDRYPKDLYELVLEEIAPPISYDSTGDLLHAFSRLDATQYTSLRHFLLKAQVLKYEIADAKGGLTDTAAIWFVLNGLKVRYPVLHRVLLGQAKSRRLTWPSLTLAIASEAYQEMTNEKNGLAAKRKLVQPPLPSQPAQQSQHAEPSQTVRQEQATRDISVSKADTVKFEDSDQQQTKIVKKEDAEQRGTKRVKEEELSDEEGRVSKKMRFMKLGTNIFVNLFS
jgi:hypothetical protein